MLKKITIVLFCVICIFAFANNIVYVEEKQGKNVLVLHSYHRGDVWVDNIEDGIKSILANNKNINIQIEYMDTKRIDNHEYYKKLFDLYMHKYNNQKFDVIISSDNAAFEFLKKYRNELFSNTPVVFCGVNNFDYSLVEEIKNFTGVIEEVDFESNIRLMLELQPQVECIVTVMDDTILGEEYKKALNITLKENQFGVPIINIKGKTLNDTINEINTFKKKTAILFMASRFKDNNGYVIPSREALHIMRGSIDNPIFGTWDSLIDNGIIGGKLISGYYQGQAVGKIAIRILEGQNIENIPIKEEQTKKFIFDYNELKNYKIDLSKLPKDNVIINMPPSAYSIAKNKFKQATLVIVLIFIAIIILLYLNILKRRKVEAALKENKATLQKNFKFLRVMLDAIPNPIFYKDIRGRYIDTNIAYTEYMGLKREDIINGTIYDINQGETVDYHHKMDTELIKNRGKQTYEAKVKFADGTFRDVFFSKAALLSDKNEVEGIVGVMVDITERKKTEKKINRLLKLKEAMLEINHSIIGTNNINDLFDLIMDKAIEVIECVRFGCTFILDENNSLKAAAYKGYESKKIEKFSIPLKNSFLWYRTKGNIEKTVIINDLESFNNYNALDIVENVEGVQIKSTIIAPIIIEGKLFGVVNVDSDCKNEFTHDDLEIMEYFRNQIEIAISKHKLYEETIYLSRYDKLTNVYNRRYFEELFDKYFHKAVRYDEEFCFVIFDLNGLKIVNDTYGHLAGDKYIKTFASGLSSRIRSSDIFARLGGDEFVSVFFEIDSKKLALKFEKLAENFKNNPIDFEGNSIVCSFSYGIAGFPYDAKTYKQMVRIADERMYKYKHEVKSKKSYKKEKYKQS
jgi:diguanylate cyclase (GGDEF)-like protein/PAS domain S-box-containing protein